MIKLTLHLFLFCIDFRLGWAMGCLYFGHVALVDSCFRELFVKYYFTFSLFVMVASLSSAILIVHISLKGTLINAYPRRHVPKLLFVKVIFCFYLYNFNMFSSSLCCFFTDVSKVTTSDCKEFVVLLETSMSQKLCKIYAKTMCKSGILCLLHVIWLGDVMIRWS